MGIVHSLSYLGIVISDGFRTGMIFYMNLVRLKTLLKWVYVFFFSASMHLQAAPLDYLWSITTDGPAGLITSYEADNIDTAILVGGNGAIYNLDLVNGNLSKTQCRYGVPTHKISPALQMWMHIPTAVSFHNGYLFIQHHWGFQRLDWQGCQDGTDEADIKLLGVDFKTVGMGGLQFSGGICDHIISEDKIYVLFCKGKINAYKFSTFEKLATGRPLPSSNQTFLSSGKSLEVADAELRLFEIDGHFYVTGTAHPTDRYEAKPKLVEFDPVTLSRISEQIVICESQDIWKPKPKDYIVVGVNKIGDSFRYTQIAPGIFHNRPIIFSMNQGACLEHTNLSIYDDWDLRTLKLHNSLAFHGSKLYEIAEDRMWSVKDQTITEQLSLSCSSAITNTTVLLNSEILVVTCLNYTNERHELDRVFGFKLPSDLRRQPKKVDGWIDKIKSMFN